MRQVIGALNLIQSISMDIDIIDLAWLAGFLEGEGSFHTSKTYACISAHSCDKDVLDRAASLIGATVYTHPGSALSKKSSWQFRLARRNDVKAVCLLVRPFMGDRRTEQIDKILKFVEDKEKKKMIGLINGK